MRLKRLELAWKSLFLRVVTSTMARSGSGSAEISRDAPLRILVLRQDRLGDAVVTTGLLRALKEANPGNVVDVLASPANASVLRRDPNVGTVHIYNKRKRSTFPALRRAMRARDYDVAIDCMITAPSMTGLLVMLASGARHRIGISGRGVDAALTHPVELPAGSPHIIDLMAALASPIVGGEDVDMSPRLEVQHEERMRADEAWGRVGDPSATRLLVNVSGRKPERDWPAECYVAVIREVLARFEAITVGVVGTPADRAHADRIAGASGATYFETPTIQNLIALVATADCVLTPDTSVTHIASALHTPAVVLFPREEVAVQWGLYRSPGAHVYAHGDDLMNLAVAPVVGAVAGLVTERRTELKDSSR